MSLPSLQSVLKKAELGLDLSREDLLCLLRCQEPEQQELIFASARALRQKHFGSTVFLYGFVYFSTWCQNDCAFCFYRCSNAAPQRYRQSQEQILAASMELAQSGVNLIDLTMGEDSFYLSQPERLIGLVRAVKAASGLPVMVSPGLLAQDSLRQLAAAGATWYALYQETYSRELFARLRLGQSFAARWTAKQQAAAAGMLLEEGLLVGLGEQPEQLAESLLAMRRLGARQLRAMTFVPQKGIPLTAKPGFEEEILLIAVLRLLFPDRLIPASLDVEGLDGLALRLDAGANVVTSLIPPNSGLAGVAHANMDIAGARRSVAGVLPVLQARNLVPATNSSYQSWLDKAKKEAGNRPLHSLPKQQALVVGGRLQGIELCYLAHVAGYHVTLIDCCANVPAKGLADDFIQADLHNTSMIASIVAQADIVLPALEDEAALRQLLLYAKDWSTDVVCDLPAYRLSACKKSSNARFAALNLPMPLPWPECGYPVIVKPANLSGSSGVRLAHNPAELEQAIAGIDGEPVIQQYLDGPSYSMEVIGNGQDFALLPITEVVCGGDFDSWQILAPAKISAAGARQFRKIALALAQSLQIDGIFDIEVIAHDGQLYLLEIDARFPSQTPVSIYQATGLNMVEVLARRHQPGYLRELDAWVGALTSAKTRCCSYQQIAALDGKVEPVGEHALSQAAPLSLHLDLWGADVVMTNWQPQAGSWQAICVLSGSSRQQVEQRFAQLLDRCLDQQFDRQLDQQFDRQLGNCSDDHESSQVESRTACRV